MKIIQYILIFFCFSFSFSQNYVSAKVFSKKENTPLVYASIYFQNKSKGVYSNIEGVFKIDTSNTQNTKLVISYLGYKSIYVDINKIDNNSIFFLESEESVLDEITLVTKKQKNKLNVNSQNWIKNRRKETKFKFTSSTGLTLGVLIDKGLGRNFGKFEFYYKKQKTKPSNKIRVYFYERDKFGNPTDKLILNSELIYELPYKSEKLSLDLSYLEFKIPNNGFFIGIEFLGNESGQINSGTTLYFTKRLKNNVTYMRSWGNSWRNHSKNLSFLTKYRNLKYSYSYY